MTVKTNYNVGDDAWIHGIKEGKLSQGRVIKKFTLEEAGYDKDLVFYIIEIPTHVDPILEIRNWFNMSQDEKGPIGLWRSKI